MKPPISVMRGKGWQRCCICFEVHMKPYEGLYKDKDGEIWDFCKGKCAEEAGYGIDGTSDPSTRPTG